MILIIDNYDSFTYNLYQLAGGINPDIKVVRNDAVSTDKVLELAPSHILISPGPGRPKDAGICEDLIRKAAGKIPTLGVCLGHQAICECFGAQITYASRLVHGKKCRIQIANGNPLFRGLPPIIEAARYHSLVAARETVPDDLLIIAEDERGEVMGVKHREYEIYGVQFHPESILTECGHDLLTNFFTRREANQ